MSAAAGSRPAARRTRSRGRAGHRHGHHADRPRVRHDAGEPAVVTSWPAGYRHGESSSRRSTRCSSERGDRARRDRAASSSARGPARSPGCGSGSRRPRAWRTGSACRSSGSRRARRCWPPPRARARSRSNGASCSCRPGRRTGSSCVDGVAPALLHAGDEPDRSTRRTPGRGRPRRSSAGRRARAWRGGARRPRAALLRAGRPGSPPATRTTSPDSSPSTSRCRAA